MDGPSIPCSLVARRISTVFGRPFLVATVRFTSTTWSPLRPRTHSVGTAALIRSIAAVRWPSVQL